MICEQHVTMDGFIQALLALGINTRARNFLVFQVCKHKVPVIFAVRQLEISLHRISITNMTSVQGDIEKVAQQSPADLASFFELISGSEALKDDYRNLQLAVEQADIKNGNLYARKRSLQAKKKLTKEAKAEAEKYQNLGRKKVSCV